MHLRGRAQNHGVHVTARQALVEGGGHVTNAVPCCNLFGFVQVAADERRDLHTVNELDGVQVFDAEGAGTRQCNTNGHEELSFLPFV